MRNIWNENKFAKEYAEKSVVNGGDAFEGTINEPSLLSMIPDGARKILDFGCSSGHFAEQLRRKNMK